MVLDQLTSTSITREDLLGALDRGFLLDAAVALIESPSPTGHEEACATVLGELLASVGCDTRMQPIYTDRANVIGRIRGQGNGPAILLSGHLDTSVRGDEQYLKGRGWVNRATIDGDRIYGNGISNMKGAFVSYLGAVQILKRLGIRLPGDLTIAGTAGEVEMAAVDEFQGADYDGYGMGLRYLQLHGVMADVHILGEPTGMLPMTGVMGTVWAKVTVHGDFVHSAWSSSATSANDELIALWRGLDDWIREFSESNGFAGVPALVNRAAIRGGLPWRAARTANVASMYLDLRFSPGRFPVDVAQEFRAGVERVAADVLRRGCDIEFYLSRPGTVLSDQHPLVACLEDASSAVTGRREPARFAPPFCTDAIDSNRYGCPTIIYGPGGGPDPGSHADPGSTAEDGDSSTTESADGFLNRDHRSEEGEFVYLENLAMTAAVYALTCVALNEQGRESLVAHRGATPCSSC